MDPVNGGKVRTTTIRLTPRDQKSIEKLMELTGGNLTSTIRYAIRRTLWEAKLPQGGYAAPDNRTSPVREKGR